MSEKLNIFGNPIVPSSAVELARAIDNAVAPLPEETPEAPSLRGFVGEPLSPRDSSTEAPVAQFNDLGDEVGDTEWDRARWLAWYESEFAGYQREAKDDLVEDDAGENDERQRLLDFGVPLEDVDHICPAPIQVQKNSLARDRELLRWLQRSGGNRKVRFQRDGRWVTKNLVGTRRNAEMLREGPDGGAVVIGAHPFSAEEGAAEWLGRVRCELRDAYRRAGSDRERKAIVSREAAMRARHNARCWTRVLARYYGVDENLSLSLLDLYQKKAPIGWLGIEAEMREAWLDAERHFEAQLAAWDAAFDGKWSRVQRDEWVDRMPTRPEHPTQLVTSVKTLRKYREVPNTNSLPKADIKTRTTPRGKRHYTPERYRIRQHGAALLVKLEGLRAAPRISRGNVRRWLRPVADTWYADVKEWERAECVQLYTRYPTPENYPCDWVWGELNPEPSLRAA